MSIKSKHKREYTTYTLMKQRCYNENHTHYSSYGGRGIRVCDRWLASFHNFLADMGGRPDGMTLDRVNNDAGYNKGNCRWTDSKTQARNRRNSHIITYKGRSMCVAEWSDVTGVEYQCLMARLYRGWSDGEALGYEMRPKAEYKGSIRIPEMVAAIEGGMTKAEYAGKIGVAPRTVGRLYNQIKKEV
tara:strand:+ start:184 stop:744 length:561 start_codon:yes stop_codon:yes gene_type:complete